MLERDSPGMEDEGNARPRGAQRESNEPWVCPYDMRAEIRDYAEEQVYPGSLCPWLYYAVYPYMLGLLYGADFRFNEHGDANVGCPARNGVRALVRKRPHPGHIEDRRIGPENTFVIYAEVVGVGQCPHGHAVGDKLVFPTCMKGQVLCPASWYHAFPFLGEPVPDCIDTTSVRCPDWNMNMMMGVGGGLPAGSPKTKASRPPEAGQGRRCGDGEAAARESQAHSSPRCDAQVPEG